ncbi:MAG: PQQ-dependent sugar dehydrogenase [Verrucomicrobia bacterium]|nr:PQQ-dependent sugar dehydrogenase [Verrucomicrobiota bacterium]MDA1068650.1 PQQ-dependent sugar dehydrogenase [Verrucomicrobiota bacterium]
MIKRPIISCISLFLFAFFPHFAFAEVPDGVWVRDGFELTVAEDTIKKPRFMALDTDGTLYVSVIAEGKILACKDLDGDGKYESITPFIEGKDANTRLQGIQLHNGWLYFSQLNAISRAKDTDADGKADLEEEILGEDDLPTGKPTGHRWRALLIHKGRIYTHVGDQTNATDEPIDASERKKIWSFKLNGSDKKLFASGIRNSEKLVVRPGTDEIWGVDHDIDQMAWGMEGENHATEGQPITDHNPPAELNHYQEGKFYGHPWVVGKNMPNLMFIDHPKLMDYARMATIPEWTMAAHSSANSLTFYRGNKIPGAHGDAFVAQKGGWNATEKVGYRLARILFEDGKPYGEQAMVSFLKGDEVLGRPVDCVQAPDGSLLFSDDTGNKVYRLRWVGKK